MGDTEAMIQPQQPDSTDPLLRIGEAADILNVSRPMVYKLMDEQGLPFVQLTPTCKRIRRSALFAWIDARASSAGEASAQ